MPSKVRRAKIVATLGPASDGHERALVDAGLDVARLNFSHGTHEEHAGRATAIREAAAAAGRTVAVLMDLQGPKIRVGRIVEGGPINLTPGQQLAITTEDVVGTPELVSCTYEGLPDDVQPGDRILMDDGRIRLRVLSRQGPEVQTVVVEGGPLGEHKGINLPGVKVSSPSLTEKDRDDLAYGLRELRADYVALSFVRSAEDVRGARALMTELGFPGIPLISKLEKSEAIDDLAEVLLASDGVMVARGDLGVELPPERVPVLQKSIIRRANQLGIPVITATQMLESMMEEETPTRAEASDVANAVWDGTDAVMLSGETAAGRHPVQALKMMDRIVREAESATELVREGSHSRRAVEQGHADGAAAVAHAAQVLADDLLPATIVAVTRTGTTARLLSRGRPRAPIVAFAPDPSIRRQLALWWGVQPLDVSLGEGEELGSASMERHLIEAGLAGPGDAIVIVGVHPFQPGRHTNFVKYQTIGES